MCLIRLERFARRKPDQISGGQRQLVPSPARSGYCLCMNRWPHWTKKLRHDTQFELMDIQERIGTTFVLVPHDQEETMTIQPHRSNGSWPDHVGRDACGYYEMPHSVHVADFIGDEMVIADNAERAGPGL